MFKAQSTSWLVLAEAYAQNSRKTMLKTQKGMCSTQEDCFKTQRKAGLKLKEDYT